jgi:hypothetical protein
LPEQAGAGAVDADGDEAAAATVATVEAEVEVEEEVGACPLAGFRGLPAVQSEDKFVAMSVFFFALDCLRALGDKVVVKVADGDRVVVDGGRAGADSRAEGEGEGGEEMTAATTFATSPSSSSSALDSEEEEEEEARDEIDDGGHDDYDEGDAVHALLVSSWPSPPLQVVSKASERFCRSEWAHVSSPGIGDAHGWTWASQLPHRCFETVFIATLLGDGMGFDKEARQVTFAQGLAGTEVEWTLGFALASKASQQ